ncbi:MAG: NAD(P)-dependent alcohol dehydrogenase [Pyrinomonadaceae bacterium]
MKAYQLDEFGIDKLVIVERDEPKVRPDEVLVRVRAASLNYRDVMVASGTYNPRMKLPATPLSDAAGEVIGLGADVTKWKIGDRVMPIFAQRWFDGESSEEMRRTALGAGAQWDGVLREYAAFREDAVVAVPEHLSFEEAATLPCAAVTAWNALVVSGNLKPGKTVLTLGTGGVSVFAVQIAKLMGARVIATSSSKKKLEKLQTLGADHIINYREKKDWDSEVLAITGGVGADHVVEVGGSGTLAKSLNAVRIGGHVAMIGALTGPGDFNPITLFMKAVRLQGIFVGSKKMFEDLLKAVSLNKITPVIERVFDFDDARAALHYMESGSHFGKIVIRL